MAQRDSGPLIKKKKETLVVQRDSGPLINIKKKKKEKMLVAQRRDLLVN